MKHKYQILQIPFGSEAYKKKAYMWLDYVNEKLGGFDINDYEIVYEGEIEGSDPISILDELWVIFNINHPNDYHGRSMSVSDVVVLDDAKYFCDSIGWEKV